MTYEKKLQELTAEIRKKLPHLMQLGEACYIERGEVHKIIDIVDFSDEPFITICNHIIYEFSPSDITDCKIIGKEPMLNDVLGWLWIIKNADEIYYIEEHGEIYCRWRRGNDVSHNYCGNWDLSKPYLRDQGEALIDFLYNLIRK